MGKELGAGNTRTTTTMTRTEIIFELAKYCHQDWYKSILNWPTHYLKALLEYYQKPEPKPKKQIVIVMGIDIAEGEDESITYKWPFGYAVNESEPLKNKMRFQDVRPKRHGNTKM